MMNKTRLLFRIYDSLENLVCVTHHWPVVHATIEKYSAVGLCRMVIQSIPID